jgi:predicted MFS family arabinose efflux permease
VFWFAVLPAVAAVVILALGVKEPERHNKLNAPESLPPERAGSSPTQVWRNLRQLGSAFWTVVAIGAVVTLARFSEAFLVIRTHDAGLSLAATPLALVAMNAAYVVSAYPSGRLSDRVDRAIVLVAGLGVLIVADLLLAWGEHLAPILIGVALWGLHMGLTQGLFAALVANAAPAELRGLAFGVFNFVSGLVAITSSLLAGALWERFGPSTTFLAGAAYSCMAVGILVWWRRH